MSVEVEKRSPRCFRRKKATGGAYCCVPGCTNTLVKDREVGRKLSYYTFPLQDQKRIRLWVSQIRRESWFPKSYDRICSIHFEGGKKSNNPKEVGYIPTVFPSRQKPAMKRTSRTSSRAEAPVPPPAKRRIFEKDITPNAEPIDLPVDLPINKPADTTTSETSGNHLSANLEPNVSLPETVLESTPADSKPTNPSWQADHDYILTTVDPTPYSTEHINLQKKVQALTSEVEDLKKMVLSLDSVKKNDTDFMYLTNFHNYAQFEGLCEFLFERCDGNLKYWVGQGTDKHVHFASAKQNSRKPGRARKLSFEEEFFLVLVKLKRGLDNKDLSMRFGMSESTVSRTVTTWINYLNNELSLLFEMPPVDKSCVDTMPVFDEFPDVDIVLDCTELFTERSSDLLARKETFSNYKNHDTVKFLVGMSPYQSITFVSAAWGGRASDKHITMHSDSLLDNLDAGSSVMADRGFLVTDELAKLGVKLIMPHFKGSDRPQFTAAESVQSAKISSARVHIERAIQRIKTYQTLERSIRMNQRDLIEQTFRVCAYLTNFQSPIVKC